MRPSPAALLRSARQPALLVSNITNIRYLTGYSVEAGLVLVLPRAYILYTTFTLADPVGRPKERVTVRDLALLERAMKRVPVCGFEEDHVTVAGLKAWKKQYPSTKFTPVSGVVEEFRRAKGADELRLMRRAHAITAELLRRVPAVLKPGVTERAVEWLLRTWARELGAERMAFDPIVGFGANSSRPHHAPGSAVLKKNDIVQIDVGAVYGGYCSDRSEVYFVGKPNPEWRRAYDAVKAAVNAAKKAAVAGVSTHELDGLARETLRERGYPERHIYPHSLGHGVGLEIHEGVIMSPRRPENHLLKNEVATVEPALYIPGKFGIRIEEIVIVK